MAVITAMNHKVKKLLKFLCAMCLLVLLGVVAGYFFRAPVLGFVLQKSFARLEQQAGIHASFSDVEWDQGGRIRLYGIELKNEPAQSEGITGSIAEVELRYSWAALLQGIQPFLQTAKINIISPSFEFIWNDTQDAASASSGNGFLLPLDLPPMLPGVAVFDGSVSVHHPDAVLSGEKMEFVFQPSCVSQNLHGACLDVEKGLMQVAVGDVFEEQLALAGKLFYGNGILQVPTLHFTETSGFVDFHATAEGQRVQFAGNWFSREDTIGFSGGYVDGAVSLTFNSNSFNLKNTPAFLPDLQQEGAGKIKVSGNILLPVAHIEKTSGTIDLEITCASYGERTIRRILLQASAQGGMLQCPVLAIETPGTMVTVHNLLVDIENLAAKKWDTLLKETEATITAQISDAGEMQHFLPEDIRDSFAGIGILDASLAAQFKDNTLEVETFTLQAKSGTAVFEDVTVSFRPALSDWQHWPVTVGHLSFDIPELGTLEDFFPGMVPVAGKATINGRGKGTFLAFEGKAAARGEGVEIAGVPLAHVELGAAIENEVLTLSVNAGSQTGDVLTGEGSLLFAERKIKNLTAHLAVNDVAEYVTRFSLPFSASGPFQTRLSAEGTFLQPVGRLAIEGSNLSLADYSIDILYAVISSTNNIFTVEKLTATSGDTKIILNATVVPSPDWQSAEIAIEKAVLNAQDKEIRLVETGHVSVASDQFAIRDTLFFEADDGSLIVAGTMKGDICNTSVEADISSGEWISSWIFKDKVHFKTARIKAAMTGALTAPMIQLQGDITGLGADEQSEMEFSGSFDSTYQDEKITLTTFEWTGEPNANVAISGVIPFSLNTQNPVFDSSDLSLSAHFSMPDAAIISRIFPDIFSGTESVYGSMSVKGSWLDPSGNVDLKAKGFLIRPELGLWVPPGALQANCQVQLTEREIELEKCVIDSAIGSLQASGTIESETTLAALFPLKPENPVGKTAIQGHIQLDDISWLASRIEDLRRLSGEIKGTFALTGPPARPVISAEMAFANGEMRLSPTIPALREVHFLAEIDQNETEVKDLRGLIGGAPFSGSGQYRFGSGVEENFELKLQGSNLLFYRGDGIRVRGDATFVMQGNPNQPIIEGKISFTDCRYTKPVDFLTIFTSGWQSSESLDGQLLAFHDEPLKDATLRIAVGAKTPCTIKNNVIKGRLRPELALSGTGESLAIGGDVYIDGMQISMPAGRINFDSGAVHFLPEAPDRPQLNLSGNSRMMGYDIKVHVSGTSDEPVVSLSSSPILANEELLLLLLTGRKPTKESMNDQRGKNEMTNVAVYIGRGILEKWFADGDGDEDKAVLDRLQLDIGRSVTQTGEDTLEAQFLLKEKMFTENDELYLTGERDVWDDYNSGLRFIFRFD